MRFHVVALPHTQTTLEHCACAYSMKVLNFCRMMHSLGHEVYHYGCEGSQADCTEDIPIITLAEQKLLFGEYNFHKEFYRIDWDSGKIYWQLTNARATVEIMKRLGEHDFFCCIGGCSQQPISTALGDKVLPVEYGIGYIGCWAPYRVFETYAHMHRILGKSAVDPDGRWYDAVIPNYFDPQMFPFHEPKERFLLFVGRLVQRKGVHVAAEIAKAAELPLLVAGQGCKRYEPGLVVCEDGTEMRAPGLRYLGFLDVKRRGELMGRACALLAPTTYIEPFGGVVAEAAMCGTPAIATDFGSFTETIEHGRTGFRCHTLEQFTWAVKHVHELDPKYIRDRAVARYSMWNVRHMYQEYFNMVYDIHAGNGWYATKKRKDLGWLGPHEDTAAGLAAGPQPAT